MGTNYYLRQNTCPHCGRGDEQIHIGKSSAGWCFSLQVFEPYEDWTLDRWIERFNEPGAKIYSEYEELTTVEDMIGTITNRGSSGRSDGWWHGYKSAADFYSQNHAEPGPNNLCRHQIGHYCVGHGEGTYDYIPGDFS